MCNLLTINYSFQTCHVFPPLLLRAFLSTVVRSLQSLTLTTSKLFVYKCDQLLRKHDSFKLFLMGEFFLYKQVPPSFPK